MKCACKGFYNYGWCHHTRDFKKLIAKILYGSDFVEKIIKNFNNCSDFIEELCDLYPECIGNYDQLDHYSSHLLGAVGKHYRTETIHRSYRLLVETGKIIEPESDVIRKEEAEHVMHDLPKWSPKTFLGTQSQLVDDGRGLEK